MKNLINKLGMKLYAGPIVRYLDEPGNRGITAVCIIKTSHLSMHVWDEPNPGIIQFDVYTCGSMKVEDVIAELQVFNPSKIEYKFLDRENNLTLVEEGIL
jgi:S-adenosylmethionine/arginine decarboxylase-like enzyme